MATIQPPVAGVTVYFKVWDVDDPFDQVNNSMADIGLIDFNMAGPDNRPSGEGPWSFTGTTDSQGRAVHTFTVSMQPGNNYRAAATVLSGVLEGPNPQITQTDADLLSALPQPDPPGSFRANGSFEGYKVPVTWSQMLTVWRKLHVETDSMTRPAFAENTVTGQWNDPRFVGGQLWINIPDQGNYDDLENGYIRIQAVGFPDLISIIIDHESSPGREPVRTNINEATWDGRPSSGNFVASDDDIGEEANFLAGVVGSDIGIGNPPNGHLPLPDTSRLAHHYQPAYILPVVEPEHTSLTGIAFRKNINNVTEEPAWIPILPSRTLAVSTLDYWTAYVYSAFQAEGWEDYDGEFLATKAINTHLEGWTHGRWQPEYTGMSAIFVEALRDGFGDVEHQIAVAHEIGHTLGLPHSSELMHRINQTDSFAAQSLVELRSYTGP